MSFAGMVAQLLGEPVALAAWAGPVLVHLVDGPELLRNAQVTAQRPKAPAQAQEGRQSAAAGRGDTCASLSASDALSA